MPELPEVETTLRGIQSHILNKKIDEVDIRQPNLRWKVPVRLIQKNLIGESFSLIRRRAKYLIFESLTGNLIIHLGMSGTIHLLDKNNSINNTNSSFYNSPNLPSKHNHIEIFLKKCRLIYNDPRRFGFIKIFKNKKTLLKFFNNIGPEPLNKKFNKNYIFDYFINKKKNIKSFLLDQKFVSGIGNIYASEILFDSKISPYTKGKDLNTHQLTRLIKSIRKILVKAIKYGGSTIRDYASSDGTLGNFQSNFFVYNKEGKNISKFAIKKVIQYGRSTYYCPELQKEQKRK